MPLYPIDCNGNGSDLIYNEMPVKLTSGCNLDQPVRNIDIFCISRNEIQVYTLPSGCNGHGEYNHFQANLNISSIWIV